MTEKQPMNIFYSYAHEDEVHRIRLSKYLTSLRRDGKIKEWYDGNIAAGEEFSVEINKNIYLADIIVLVISTDFLNSDYCWEIELPEALKLHKEKKAKVIPVIIRPIPIDIAAAPFGNLKVLPKDGKPITKWPTQEQGWIDVAKSISEVVTQLYTENKGKPAKHPIDEKTIIQSIRENKSQSITAFKEKQVNKGKLYRVIYDGQNEEASFDKVKNFDKILRKEGEAPVEDEVANKVYENLGKVYDFFLNVYGRNSADNKGLPLKAVIHYNKNFENAFWDGRHIIIGDGGKTLKEFHDIDIVAAEFTNAMLQYETRFEYWGQSGAITIASSRIFASLVKQYYNNQNVQQASWLIGENMLEKKGIARGIYSLSDPGTAYLHPEIGVDPSISHLHDVLNTEMDNGGIHVNSGILSKAFYLAATMIEGFAWEKAGHIWYEALQSKELRTKPTFLDFAKMTIAAAERLYKKDSVPSMAFNRAWQLVGINISQKTLKSTAKQRNG